MMVAVTSFFKQAKLRVFNIRQPKKRDNKVVLAVLYFQITIFSGSDKHHKAILLNFSIYKR
jgi:hypothetical protein